MQACITMKPRGRAVAIGEHAFPTIALAQRYTRERIARAGLGLVMSPGNIEFFTDLVKNHPQHATKFALLIHSFEIKNNQLNRKALMMFVNFNNSSTDDFSWRMCCGAKAPNNLRQAMWQAVAPSILHSRRSVALRCVLCQSAEAPHVDHHTQFEALCQSFEEGHPQLPSTFDDDSLHMALRVPPAGLRRPGRVGRLPRRACHATHPLQLLQPASREKAGRLVMPPCLYWYHNCAYIYHCMDT